MRAYRSGFAVLKGQYLNHRVFRDSTTEGYDLFKYIEVYYNRRRRHSSNGWKSHAEYEAQWHKMLKAA